MNKITRIFMVSFCLTAQIIIKAEISTTTNETPRNSQAQGPFSDIMNRPNLTDLEKKVAIDEKIQFLLRQFKRKYTAADTYILQYTEHLESQRALCIQTLNFDNHAQ